MKNKYRFRLLVTTILFVFVAPFLLSSGGNPGFRTSYPSMLKGTATGGTVTPIITVGDILPNGYRFEAIPDGIGIVPNGNGTVDVFVNHETSLVPFPAVNPAGGGMSDFDNAQVSLLRLHQQSVGVLKGMIAISSSHNYQRFCSAFVPDGSVGFNHPIFITNEETSDFVSPPPLTAWPPDPSNRRQAGLVVALDTRNGKTYEIPGLGRMNHENTVVVPGYGRVVALTGDDTFSAPSSQLYMYLAGSPNDFLADQGSLYGFVSDDPAIIDYGDLVDGASVSGHFIPVPRDIAVGDQTGLENWSNANNVFQFIRVEDIAYDKNNNHIIYFADTGEPRAIPDPTTGRLRRGPSGTQGPYPNGRIFMLVLNDQDPTVVDSLSILINADAGGYNNPAAMHNPDNVDTSSNSLMITEDPGGHNSFAPGAGPNARLWRYDLTTGELSVAAEVDQSADPAARAGAWESSGVLNVSAVFGPGAWLVDVQAHTLYVDSEIRTITDTTQNPPVTGPVLFKREGGQLLLLVIPGS